MKKEQKILNLCRNISGVIDVYGCQDGDQSDEAGPWRYALALELAPHGNLAKFIKERSKPFDLQLIHHFIKTYLQTIEEILRKANVVDLDPKMENVVVIHHSHNQIDFKLIDFGEAIVFGEMFDKQCTIVCLPRNRYSLWIKVSKCSLRDIGKGTDSKLSNGTRYAVICGLYAFITVSAIKHVQIGRSSFR